VLPVKLRGMPHIPGTPSALNIGKKAADLRSTGHNTNGYPYVNGGFLYSDTLSGGRPDSPVNLPWTSYSSGAITINTDTGAIIPGTLLIPNTRYYVITYLTCNVDLWLTVPAGNLTLESPTVAQFVTLPSITAGSAVAGVAPDEAKISANFEGGNESLTVTIYWSKSAIDPNLPSSWGSLSSATLTYGTDYNYAGFTDFVISGLAGSYNILIVSRNVTGYDYWELQYANASDVTITKTVTGSFADMTKSWTFTVYFEDEYGVPLASGTTFNYVGGIISGSGATAPLNGVLTLDSQGSATFTLLHGQTITILSLPIGGYIRVVETASAGYDAWYFDVLGSLSNPTKSNDTSYLLTGVNNRTIEFTNERVTIPPSGIFSSSPAVYICLVLMVTFALSGIAFRAYQKRKFSGT
jgi:hypothetical protein